MTLQWRLVWYCDRLSVPKTVFYNNFAWATHLCLEKQNNFIDIQVKSVCLDKNHCRGWVRGVGSVWKLHFGKKSFSGGVGANNNVIINTILQTRTVIINIERYCLIISSTIQMIKIMQKLHSQWKIVYSGAIVYVRVQREKLMSHITNVD